MAQFITVHYGVNGGRTITCSLNVDHIKSIKTHVGSENAYCIIDDLPQTDESYNEVMKMLKEPVDYGLDRCER